MRTKFVLVKRENFKKDDSIDKRGLIKSVVYRSEI